MSFDNGWNPSRGGQDTTAPGVSLKTNVNRTKTKKIAEAASLDYDGGAWSDDSEDEPLPPQPATRPTGLRNQGAPSGPVGEAGHRQYGSASDAAARGAPESSRSTSHPLLAKRNSFDRGDDRRVLSGNQALPALSTRPQVPKTFSQIGVSPDGTVLSSQPVLSAGSPQQPSQTHSRSTSNQAAYQPPSIGQSGKSMAQPPAPSSSLAGPPMIAAQPPPTGTERHQNVPSMSRSSASPAESRQEKSFPPRKSSLSQQDQPVEPFHSSVSVSQPAAAPEAKPLPFVRPADIYKRIQQEKEKERQTTGPSLPTFGGSDKTITEREAGHGPSMANQPLLKTNAGLDPGSMGAYTASPISTLGPNQDMARKDSSPKLPSLSRVSGFGDDLFGTGMLSSSSSKPAASGSGDSQGTVKAESDLQHQPSQGFRSVVHQAFDKTDDLKSIPATPSSVGGSQKSNTSGVKRADTSSTSGISPIISRHSSTTHGASKLKEETERTTTPAISEDPEPVTTPPIAPAMHLNTEAEGSSDSLPQGFRPGHRREYSAPSSNNSPARSPAIEQTNAQLLTAQGAEIQTTAPLEPKRTGLDQSLPFRQEKSETARGGGLDYSLREADLASTAAQTSPPKTEVNRAEKEARAAFMESRGDPKLSAQAPRSISPTKGRVQGLKAGPNEAGSGHARPVAERETNFRPAMPGGWTSYATTAGDAGHEPYNPQFAELPAASGMPPHTIPSLGSDRSGPLGPRQPAKRLESADSGITMTSIAPPNPYNSSGVDARLDALRSKQPPSNLAKSETVGPKEVVSVGSSLAPPHSQLQRNISADSSAPPTPPPKNTPLPIQGSEESRDYFKNDTKSGGVSKEIETSTPVLSTEASTQDQESDRLTKEIFNSLSPASSQKPESAIPSQQPATQRTLSESSRIVGDTRESSYLPSEYETYFAGTKTPSIPASREISLKNQAESTNALPKDATREHPREVNAADPNPGLLTNRFSWETEGPTQPQPLNTKNTASNIPPIHKPTKSETEGIIPVTADRPTSNKTINEEKSGQLDTHKPEITSGGQKMADTPAGSSGPGQPTSATASDRKDFGDYLDRSFEAPQSVDPSFPTPVEDAKDQVLPTHPATAGPDRALPAATSGTPPAVPPKILAFREIMAMKTAKERIETFNRTQELLSTENFELSAWIAQIATDHRELINDPRSGVGAAPTFNQQMASSASQSTLPQGRPVQGQMSASASPASAKTTQQVQTKGKELLHSAGVFGGKANTAAKGFLKKGKSRLRGSDKGDQSQPTRETPSPASTASKPFARPPNSRSTSNQEDESRQIQTPGGSSEHYSDPFASPPKATADSSPSFPSGNVEGRSNTQSQSNKIPLDQSSLSLYTSQSDKLGAEPELLPSTRYSPRTPTKQLRHLQTTNSSDDIEPRLPSKPYQQGSSSPHRQMSPPVLDKGETVLQDPKANSSHTNPQVPTRKDSVSPLSSKGAQEAGQEELLAHSSLISEKPKEDETVVSVPQEEDDDDDDVYRRDSQKTRLSPADLVPQPRPYSFIDLPRGANGERLQETLPYQPPVNSSAENSSAFASVQPTGKGSTESRNAVNLGSHVPQQQNMRNPQPSIFAMAGPSQALISQPTNGGLQPPPISKYSSNTGQQSRTDGPTSSQAASSKPTQPAPISQNVPQSSTLSPQQYIKPVSNLPSDSRAFPSNQSPALNAVISNESALTQRQLPQTGGGPLNFSKSTEANAAASSDPDPSKGKKRGFFKNFGSRSARPEPSHVDTSLGIAAPPPKVETVQSPQVRQDNPQAEPKPRGLKGSFFNRLNAPLESEERSHGSRDSMDVQPGGPDSAPRSRQDNVGPMAFQTTAPDSTKPVMSSTTAGRRISMPVTHSKKPSSGSRDVPPQASSSPKKLGRAATSAMSSEAQKPRKSRLSGLGGLFGRSSESSSSQGRQNPTVLAPALAPAPAATSAPTSAVTPTHIPPYLEAASRSSSQNKAFTLTGPNQPRHAVPGHVPGQQRQDSFQRDRHQPPQSHSPAQTGPFQSPNRAQTMPATSPITSSHLPSHPIGGYYAPSQPANPSPLPPSSHPVGGYYAPNQNDDPSPSPSPDPLHANSAYAPPSRPPAAAIPQSSYLFPQQQVTSHPVPRQTEHVAPAPPPAFQAPYASPYAPFQQPGSIGGVQASAPALQYESPPIPAPYTRVTGAQPATIPSAQSFARSPAPQDAYGDISSPVQHQTPYPPHQYPYPQQQQQQPRSESPIAPPPSTLSQTAPLLPPLQASSPLTMTAPSLPLVPHSPQAFHHHQSAPSTSSHLSIDPPQPLAAPDPSPSPAQALQHVQQRPYPLSIPHDREKVDETADSERDVPPATRNSVVTDGEEREIDGEGSVVSSLAPTNIRLPESPVVSRGEGPKVLGMERQEEVPGGSSAQQQQQQQQQEKEKSVPNDKVDSDDEEIIMSPTALPGQAWEPPGFASWDGT